MGHTAIVYFPVVAEVALPFQFFPRQQELHSHFNVPKMAGEPFHVPPAIQYRSVRGLPGKTQGSRARLTCVRKHRTVVLKIARKCLLPCPHATREMRVQP